MGNDSKHLAVVNNHLWGTTLSRVGFGKAAEILPPDIYFSMLSCHSQQSEYGLIKCPKYFSLEGELVCCLLHCGAQTLSMELFNPPKSPTARPVWDLQRSIFWSLNHSQAHVQLRMQEEIPKARFAW